MTPEESQQSLATARVQFGAGQWDELHTTAYALHQAHVLEGSDQGEVAFYLGEACLGRGDGDGAVSYLEEAVQLGDADFSPWAAEELARARQPVGADDTAADPAAFGATGVDVSDHPQLRVGSTERDWVAHAQAKLAHLHDYGGQVDGWFGPLTDAAVRQFQEHWGQPADGIIDQATWSALETAAPGITGTPVAPPHHQGGGAQPGQPHEPGAVQFPDDHIEGAPTSEDHWQPLTPSLDPESQPQTTMGLGAGVTVEHTWKVKVGFDLGPVTVKEIPIKIDGRIHTAAGEDVDVSAWKSEKGPGWEVKVPIEKWENVWGSDWDVSLKGDLDFGVKTAVTGALEGTNGHAVLQVQFTVVEISGNEVSVAKATISGGARIDSEEIPGTNGELFFSGKVTVGVSLVPNVAWWAAQFGRTVAPAAVTVTEFGVGTVAAGEAIIATGFIAIAVAQLYVAYANITDIEALKQMQEDAPKAVDDFAAGFVSAWGAGSAPGGFWGSTGASAGQRQFEADVQAFAAIQRERRPELTIDDAFLDEVRQLWRTTAAEKGDEFRSVVEAMYGKMVRTAVCQAFLKAHPTSSLPGDHVRDSYTYAGLADGPSAHPDTRAGYDAAKSANMQLNIDSWNKEWEDQYGQ
ncbi:MAG: peptidoglycan-binding protein [Actinomycetota bacterium]|nr:peptidoglycan-binding protein [Acidimicrobiia bacterium]MDQ3293957.1 peptidoglycan-binding protein [Actinomycetota bacterium]